MEGEAEDGLFGIRLFLVRGLRSLSGFGTWRMRELRDLRQLSMLRAFLPRLRPDASDLGSDGISAFIQSLRQLALLSDWKTLRSSTPQIPKLVNGKGTLVDNHMVTEVSVVARKQSRHLAVVLQSLAVCVASAFILHV